MLAAKELDQNYRLSWNRFIIDDGMDEDMGSASAKFVSYFPLGLQAKMSILCMPRKSHSRKAKHQPALSLSALTHASEFEFCSGESPSHTFEVTCLFPHSMPYAGLIFLIRSRQRNRLTLLRNSHSMRNIKTIFTMTPGTLLRALSGFLLTRLLLQVRSCNIYFKNIDIISSVE